MSVRTVLWPRESAAPSGLKQVWVPLTKGWPAGTPSRTTASSSAGLARPRTRLAIDGTAAVGYRSCRLLLVQVCYGDARGPWPRAGRKAPTAAVTQPFDGRNLRAVSTNYQQDRGSA
jgi:hypothetical protein